MNQTKTKEKTEKTEAPDAPQCPVGLHNKLTGEIEYCHTHKYKWRQAIFHEPHCKKLKCPHAHKCDHGKWGGLYDTRDKKIIG